MFNCRYKKLLSSVDLTKDFFYSYAYPIMQSLQKNVMSTAAEGMPYDNIFVWNAYLTQAIRSRCNNTAWTIALVHGHFRQVRKANSLLLPVFHVNFYYLYLVSLEPECYMIPLPHVFPLLVSVAHVFYFVN